MTEIQWKTPPERTPRRVELVADQLREKPHEWALIDTDCPALALMPWWAALTTDSDFEVKRVPTSTDRLFAPGDIYARYVGKPKRQIPRPPPPSKLPNPGHPGTQITGPRRWPYLWRRQ